MLTFTTEGIPPAERARRYEEALRGYVFENAAGSVAVTAREEAIDASIRPMILGDLDGALHCINAPHALHLVPKEPAPDFDFYLLLDGAMRFECPGQSTICLAPGEMMLIPRSMELCASSSRMQMIALTIPDMPLRQRLGRALSSRPVAIGEVPGVAACLGSMLSMAAHRSSELSAYEAGLLRTSVLEILIEMLGSAGPRAPGPSTIQSWRLPSIQQRALELLAEPSLSPELMARDLRISVRTLHRAFHSAGLTFHAWLREQRLARCWSELNDPMARRRSVAAIAFRWGFNDLTTFNRNFRQRYGFAPTRVRRARSRR